MSDFILEIYGEEIPSSAQSLIENQFEKLFSQLLEDNRIKYKDLLTFSTSRRVGVYVDGLNDYIVVDRKNVLLICIKENEQMIKQYMNDAKEQKGEDYI